MNKNVKKLTPHTDGKRRKMIMTSLSAVALTAQGANPEANVTFFKSVRKPDKHQGKQDEHVEKRMLLTGDTEGHSHLISLRDWELLDMGGETGWTDGHEHPFVINDDGSITIGSAAGHNHTCSFNIATFLQKMEADDLVKGGNNKELEMKDETDNKKLAAKIETLETKLATAEKVAELNDSEKAHYLSLDAGKQVEFLGKTDKERAAVLTAIEKANPVVYTANDGTVFHKSDDPRFVKMAKEADAAKDELKKAKDEQALMVIKARAESELNNLPCSLEAQIALLQAVDKIEDEATREDLAKMFKAVNDNVEKTVFKELGSEGESQELPDANAELDRLTKKHMKENPDMGYFDAYDIVAKQNEELHKRALTGQ